jgi:hypothetical protein
VRNRGGGKKTETVEGEIVKVHYSLRGRNRYFPDLSVHRQGQFVVLVKQRWREGNVLKSEKR